MGDDLEFKKLNDGWNADPNIPLPRIDVSESDLLLNFGLNYFIFKKFSEGDLGILRFINCTRYRLGATNDEGWYSGKCRYSEIAPKWGEFYEIIGNDPYLNDPKDWERLKSDSQSDRHFLFYFRDDTFECMASDWRLEINSNNALQRKANVKC